MTGDSVALLVSSTGITRLTGATDAVSEPAGDTEIHIVGRVGGPQGRRRRRDLDILLEFAIWSLRPPVDEWCEARGACGPVGYGLSAYDLWGHAEVASRGLPERGHPLRWSALRRAAAFWLDRRAGRQRTPYAVRLRRAGEWFAEESRILATMAGNARTLGKRMVAARLLASGRWAISTVPNAPSSRTVR